MQPDCPLCPDLALPLRGMCADWLAEKTIAACACCQLCTPSKQVHVLFQLLQPMDLTTCATYALAAQATDSQHQCFCMTHQPCISAHGLLLLFTTVPCRERLCPMCVSGCWTSSMAFTSEQPDIDLILQLLMYLQLSVGGCNE